MSKRFNLWDILIGVGYGVTFTMLALDYQNMITADVSMWGKIVFLPTIFFQIYRAFWHRKMAKNETGEALNG